jgi:mannose-6-phosphate isomerase-like protein (cupin superfamily)
MHRSIAFLLASAGLLAAAPGAAQTRPDRATYIAAEEVKAVEKAIPNGDRNIRVVDIGHENFAVGIVHRGPAANGASTDGHVFTPPKGKACGRKIDATPPNAQGAGLAGGITHNSQTEGYYIVSGGGTMYTDGYIANGNELDLKELNGPTCFGMAYGTTVRTVKTGDIIIIPAGVVHGWLTITDHVDYLSFRPSQGVLTAGWVNPAIGK